MACCPTCKQELPSLPVLTVDLNVNMAFGRGRYVKLAPCRAVIASVLAKAAPDMVTYERMIFAVWGHDAPLTVQNIMKSQVAKTRKGLQELGFDIKTDWGVGYRLVNIVVCKPPAVVRRRAPAVVATA